jgi:hypothetical protein
VSLASDVRSRVVDGPHVWGRYAVRPVDRTMWSTRTLVVHAPGTTTGERALLRAWGAWPGVGALVAIAAMATLAAAPVLGTAAAVVVYGAGFALLARVTRRLRPTVRSLTVTTFHGNGRPEVHGDVALLRRALDALTVPERALRAGGIRPVDFEAVWAEVWDELPERRVRRGGTPRSPARRGPGG